MDPDRNNLHLFFDPDGPAGMVCLDSSEDFLLSGCRHKSDLEFQNCISWSGNSFSLPVVHGSGQRPVTHYQQLPSWACLFLNNHIHFGVSELVLAKAIFVERITEYRIHSFYHG